MGKVIAVSTADLGWEDVKNDIIIKTVGVSLSEEQLEHVPYAKMGDLAATYRIFLGTDGEASAYIQVSDLLMERWGKSVQELHQTAVKNMERYFPGTLVTLTEAVAQLEESYMEEMMDGKDMDHFEVPLVNDDVWILSNTEYLNGASALFYEDVEKQIEAIFPEGCYIIPSSVHEVILSPKNGISLEALKDMVRQVNILEVQKEDWLSYQIHEYDPKTRTIFRAGQEPEKGLSFKGEKETPKQEVERSL